MEEITAGYEYSEKRGRDDPGDSAIQQVAAGVGGSERAEKGAGGEPTASDVLDVEGEEEQQG